MNCVCFNFLIIIKTPIDLPELYVYTLFPLIAAVLINIYFHYLVLAVASG